MTLVTRDRTTGLRRGPIRFPDGSPPLPSGCRWCGIPQATHGWGRIESAGWHDWVQPTPKQTIARMKAAAGRAPGPAGWPSSRWRSAAQPASSTEATKATERTRTDDRPDSARRPQGFERHPRHPDLGRLGHSVLRCSAQGPAGPASSHLRSLAGHLPELVRGASA
ncbi:hypothetical protein E4K10_30190 [Streptomyces sp. T1317-0309]|nr:hypothetical protein E4K10_30190 [Streptomyces sp. T1317-0309]